MSNSSRIEAATRQHVGATLTSEQIVELVKVSDPTSTKGVYPSDAAYKRDEAGKLIPRGKMAYGDGVLEYLAANSFKVLATQDIVRRPGGKKPAVTVTDPASGKVIAPAPAPVVATGKEVSKKEAAKKASTSASQIPVATKQKARDARASV